MFGELLRILLLLLQHLLDVRLRLLDIFLRRAGVPATVEASGILLVLSSNAIFRRGLMLGKTAFAQIS